VESMAKCVAEKRAKGCRRSGIKRHYTSAAVVFGVPGPAPQPALTIEVNQAGAKELLQWEAGTQLQSDSTRVARDHRSDFQ
jgi:hypothetical protein